MAKYRLSNNNKIVDCNILDENLLANTYTVKFKNGIIKDVSKNKVYDLDHIDEAVLDRLKEFASSLWDNIVKAGKFVVLKIKGMLVPVNTPINSMIMAQTINGVSFYPSEQTASAAEELGIDANIVEEDSIEDEAFIDDINAYWKNEIETYIEENGIEESFNPRLNKTYNKPLCPLYEEVNTAAPNFEMSSGAWPNLTAKEILSKLIDQFNAFQNGNALIKGRVPLPYCIWGPPGVGKSQIIRELVDLMKDILESEVDMMSLNAMSMRKDDFAYPVRTEEESDMINSRGEKVRYKKFGASDILKTWLPAYNPRDPEAKRLGISVEQLDDLANGGDGSGNGKGGVIFLDEMSRISADVLNVLMTLVQSRQINDFVLGSKWMIVAAANPPQVLGTAGERFQWDDAQTDRFQHIFFSPSFQDWLEWAQEPMDDSGKPRVHPDIIKFLIQHPDCWNNGSMRWTSDKKDKVAKSKYANPRGWASASIARREEEDARAEENDPNSIVAKARKRAGIRPRPAKLSLGEIGDIIASNVGRPAAEAYMRHYSFDGIFGADLAANVWVDGENTDIPFESGGLSMVLDRAIEKIFDNHPDNGKPSGEITPEQFTNLCTYVVRCVDQMDEDSGASKDVVLKSAEKAVWKQIGRKPFRIDLYDPENQQKYKEGLLILTKRGRSTRKNIQDMKESVSTNKLYVPLKRK